MSATSLKPVKDLRSFEAMAERLGARLYKAAVSLCRNSDEAEDLVQDTLLQAFRKWDQFEGRSDPATWLYTIAARLCQRRHRRKAGEPSTLQSLDELLPPATGPIVDVSAIGDPHRAYSQNEIRNVASAAIAELPPTFRVPLVLVDIAEMSTSEAANILGVKEATVKTRVHRARLKLRQVLASQLPSRSYPGCEHERRVCLDLLRAKQESLDRRVSFSMSNHALCDRCASVFMTMDLGLEVCRLLGGAVEPPPGLLQQIIARCGR